MRVSRYSKCVLRIAILMLAIAGTAEAQVCIRIDKTRDTLAEEDRSAAVLHLTRQFETVGRRVVPDCPTPYMVSHIQLGDAITVTLSGPEGLREGTALGLGDLPALYSQLVRSLAGQHHTVDRSNVTSAQATGLRVHSDSYFYARLGYGSTFNESPYGMPSLGFGHRSEMDSFAIDVSFLNFQVHNGNNYSSPSNVTAATLLKLEALYFVHSKASATPYFGGGLGWGYVSAGSDVSYNGTINKSYSAWNGNGLQGELTAGYEFARTTTLRLFVQADASLPFYSATSNSYLTGNVVTNRRYVPSLAFSLGLGWGRNQH